MPVVGGMVVLIVLRFSWRRGAEMPPLHLLPASKKRSACSSNYGAYDAGVYHPIARSTVRVSGESAAGSFIPIPSMICVIK
jgi:hypothetical protein